MNREILRDKIFENCINLTTVDLSNVTRMIPEGMFYGCSKLKDVYIKREKMNII